jgi:glycosyltransferase involved in cell wall biosynthesis
VGLPDEHRGEDRPVLSAIVISRDDEKTIARTLRAVVEQKTDEAFEVIVVVSGSDRTAEIVRNGFPSVKLVVLDGSAFPGKARNAGLALAIGDFVSFPGSHVELPEGSLAARIEAHRRGYAMVTGSLLNGTPTPAGWASYFMDHSAALPGRPSEGLAEPPSHCSYRRDVFDGPSPFPENMRAGEDTVVNTRLWSEGHRAWRDKNVLLFHRSPCATPWRLMRHHFGRGRAWGRILSEKGESLAVLRNYAGRRMARTATNVSKWGPEFQREFDGVRALIRLGIFSAWAGMAYEMIRRRLKPAGTPSAGNAEGHP